MCETCGCSPCMVCGMEVEDGLCTGCQMPPNECQCDIEDEEFE